MIQYDVKRGVGRKPEIFGLTNKYLGYCFLALLVGFVVFALLRVFSDNSFLAFGGLVGVVGGAIAYFQSVSVKHGDHGLDKLNAYRKRPRTIVVSSRRTFLDLRKPRA